MSDVVVNGEVLEKDAEAVWQDASDKLLAMKAAVPAIATPDFSIVFGAASLSAKYRAWSDGLGTYLDGGSDECLLFEKRLLQAVIAYEKAQGASEAEIQRLQAEIDV